MDAIAESFIRARVILGFLLVMFVPGFALSLVLFPRWNELSFIGRMAYSAVLSIGSVIVLGLFIDTVLGLDTTPYNIFISIIVFTIFALIIWVFELWFIKSNIKARLYPLLTMDFTFISTYSTRLKEFVISRLRH
jgi:uncharacterized membrane protein